MDDGPLFDQAFYRRHLPGLPEDRPATGPCWYSHCGLYYFVNFKGQFTLCHDDFREDTILGAIGQDNLADIDVRVAELLAGGGAERCQRCNKRQREWHHGENIDAESRVKSFFYITDRSSRA